MNSSDRPNPDELLKKIQEENEKNRKGKLKIFFGMCAGVGKTYSMLKAAQQDFKEGSDIVVGYAETHNRIETVQLLNGLEIIPRHKIHYKGITLEEMDLDAILSRKPEIVLIDELAHTNIPGSRHLKRYQDIIEIIDSGINVYTTLNVQHLESRAETVKEITGIKINETVPDSIVENADEIELIDISPDELLKRLDEGKVYIPDRAKFAVENFFRKGNLHALREMSLRLTAERVDMDMLDYMRAKNIMATWKTTEKLMVAVGPSPSSGKLIRWTRRMAYNMGAQWIAVSIDLGNKLSDKNRESLSNNQELAKELGAKIIHITDNDIVSGLIRAAKENNVSQIIIGKTNKTLLHNLLKGGSLVDRLIEGSGNIDVYVVKADKEMWSKSIFNGISVATSTLKEYLISFITIILTSSACFPIKEIIGYQTVGLILLLIVAALSLFLGRGPVFFAAFLNVIIWDFLFIPPLFTFHIHDLQDVIMLFANLFIALVVGTLISRIRKNQSVLKKSQKNISTLYSLLEALNHASSIKDLVVKARAELKKHFNADAIIYLKVKEGNHLASKGFGNLKLYSEKEFAVACWAFNNKKSAGKFTNTLPNSDLQYFPLIAQQGIIGIAGIKFEKDFKPGQDIIILLNSFINQITSTLNREISIDIAKENQIFMASQKLFQTILNSVSHELRTPVSIIVGAADNLMDKSSKISNENKNRLVNEISIAAFRLNRLIENILNMQRLESGMLKPKFDWCDMNELINNVLNRLSAELSKHQVKLEIDQDFPIVKLDFGLMEQALFNILHNASIYTPANTKITIQISHRDGMLEIIIKDDGKGFPEKDTDKIFTMFYRPNDSKAGGTGLGLSIAKGFIEAQNGTVKVENQIKSGAKFTIVIPTESIKMIDLDIHGFDKGGNE